MAEYIGCRKCDSPDCKGCNLKNLETMLNNGKFDCMKAREMAFDIYKKLFGTIPSDQDNTKIECAFDALNDINRIEKDTLEVLNAVIGRIGD